MADSSSSSDENIPKDLQNNGDTQNISDEAIFSGFLKKKGSKRRVSIQVMVIKVYNYRLGRSVGLY